MISDDSWFVFIPPVHSFHQLRKKPEKCSEKALQPALNKYPPYLKVTKHTAAQSLQIIRQFAWPVTNGKADSQRLCSVWRSIGANTPISIVS